MLCSPRETQHHFIAEIRLQWPFAPESFEDTSNKSMYFMKKSDYPARISIS